MKQNVIPALVKHPAIHRYEFAMVDDNHPLFEALVGDRPVPQFRMFVQRGGVWVSWRMSGECTLPQVFRWLQTIEAQ
jgi:hypothetical protein